MSHGERELYRDYELYLKNKKRAFEIFQSERQKASEAEQDAVSEIRSGRELEMRRQNEIERRYRETMQRYSMQENEARDRAFEKVLESDHGKAEKVRLAYVERRDRLRKLEKEVSPIDEMKELDIDMTKEPDFKSSYPSADMQSLGSDETDR
jgi:hypothetical protein